jgi:NADPH2:quinone reductase
MKAAVYYENGAPSVLRYEKVADPACHPKGVVIRVEAVSIEGGDVLNRWRGALTARPHIVGYQAAGEIVEVGAEVEGLRVGQKVATVGASGFTPSFAPWRLRVPGRFRTVSIPNWPPSFRSPSAPPTNACSSSAT